MRNAIYYFFSPLTWVMILGQNWLLPICHKLFNKMPYTFQQNALCLKLIRKMSLFWNSIFYKSSFKCKTRFLEHRVIAKVDLDFFFFFGNSFFEGTRVSWTWVLHLELKFMELEFQNFFVFFLDFITRLFKNEF